MPDYGFPEGVTAARLAVDARLRHEIEPYVYVAGRWEPCRFYKGIILMSELFISLGAHGVYVLWAISIGRENSRGVVSDESIVAVLRWRDAIYRSRVLRSISRVLRVSPDALFSWESPQIEQDLNGYRYFWTTTGRSAQFAFADLLHLAEMG